jgi:hypothetical protein
LIEANCRGLAALLVVALLLVAGCALSDYEAQMDKEQNRLKTWDLETEYLMANPLKVPKSEDAETAVRPDEIFFRAPKGTTTTPFRNDGPLHVYRHGSGGEILFAAIKTSDPKKREEARDTFRTDIFKAFPAAMDRGRSKDLQPDPERPPMHFEGYQLQLENQPTVYLYFYTTELYTVAIGFRVMRTVYMQVSFDTLIDYSLGSLLVGPLAVQKHRTWKPPIEPVPPPKTGTKG